MKVRFLLGVLLRGKGSQGSVKFIKEVEDGDLGVIFLNIYLANRGRVTIEMPINLAYIRQKEKLVKASVTGANVFLIKGVSALSVDLNCMEETAAELQETKEALLKQDWLLEEERDVKKGESN